MSNSTILPVTSFFVLLALSNKPSHGYDLQKQIRLDTSDHVVVGAGALYTTLQRLVRQGLIEEIPDSSRKRSYRLTLRGWEALSKALHIYNQAVTLGKERRALGSFFDATA